MKPRLCSPLTVSFPEGLTWYRTMRRTGISTASPVARLGALVTLSLALFGAVDPLLALVHRPAEGAERVVSLHVAAPARRKIGDARASIARQPIRFEANKGQTDDEVHFLARTGNGMLFLTSAEAVLRVPRRQESSPSAAEEAVVRFRPVGGRQNARVTGVDRLPGVSNYFCGDDPSKWRTNIPAYGRVRYENIYQGIDLFYYGNAEGRMEYDFVVAPGADPTTIRMAVEGADGLSIGANGDLLLSTSVGIIRQQAPYVYQTIGGVQRAITGRFELHDEREVTFALGDYDANATLVIDPELVYSSYLGGSSGINFAYGLAVDAGGNAYITGVTGSTDFPLRNPLDGMPPQEDGSKAFVTKLGPDGTLVYSTYLGGNDLGSSSTGGAIAVDATGAIYLAGTTGPGFPIKNAFQGTIGGFSDAFVTKLSPDGASLIYSSYLGGNGAENGSFIEADHNGVVYVAGSVYGDAGTTFPSVNPTQPGYGGGQTDIFFSIVDAGGGSLLFSTLHGGNSNDSVDALSIDNYDNAFLSGRTESSDFSPDCTGATDDECQFVGVFRRVDDSERFLKTRTPWDSNWEFGPPPDAVPPFSGVTGKGAVVSEIEEDELPGLEGTGNRGDRGVNPNLRFLAVAALTCSPFMDECSGLFLTVYDSNLDVVRRVELTDQVFADTIAVDARGAVYIAGYTSLADLATVNPVQAALAGVDDAYIAVFSPGSLRPAFVSYLGGSGSEYVAKIALDAQGNIYLVGGTQSPDFPITPGAVVDELRGSNGIFVSKISAVAFDPDFALNIDPPSLTVTKGDKGQISVSVNRTGGFDGRVTVEAPNTRAIKVKLAPAEASTTGGMVTFAYKIKKKAPVGTYNLVFRGRDADNRERTAPLTLTVE